MNTKLLYTLTAFAICACFATTTVSASDHLDAPLVALDGRLDINDS